MMVVCSLADVSPNTYAPHLLQDTSGGDGDEVYPPGEAPTYSTAELTRPAYSTDTFRMYCFKVLRCSKRYAHE